MEMNLGKPGRQNLARIFAGLRFVLILQYPKYNKQYIENYCEFVIFSDTDTNIFFCILVKWWENALP